MKILIKIVASLTVIILLFSFQGCGILVADATKAWRINTMEMTLEYFPMYIENAIEIVKSHGYEYQISEDENGEPYINDNGRSVYVEYSFSMILDDDFLLWLLFYNCYDYDSISNKFDGMFFAKLSKETSEEKDVVADDDQLAMFEEIIDSARFETFGGIGTYSDLYNKGKNSAYDKSSIYEKLKETSNIFKDYAYYYLSVFYNDDTDSWYSKYYYRGYLSDKNVLSDDTGKTVDKFCNLTLSKRNY